MNYMIYVAISVFGTILTVLSFEQGNQVGLVLGVICFLIGMLGQLGRSGD